MAVSPVSSVSFRNNYSNIGFEGKKKNDKNVSVENTRSSMLKAIPLAALIAMSPLTSTKAQTFAKNEKIINFEQYDETKKGLGDVVIWFLSTDGDDNNAEILRYTSNKTIKYSTTSDKAFHDKQSCDISKFRIVNVSSKYGNSTEYYVSGPGTRQTHSDGRPVMTKNFENLSIKISPEMFKYLKSLVGDQIECKTENRVVEFNDEEDVDDLFDF